MDTFNFKEKINTRITLKEYLSHNKYSLKLVESYYSSVDEYLNDNGTLLFSGTNDYRKYSKGEPLFIPASSKFSGGSTLGNGIYATPNYECAKLYGEGASQPLITGGRGCSKNVFIRLIKVKDNRYDEIKGIILNEKKNYKDEEWDNLIKDMNFIVNGNDKDGSELVFIKQKDDLLIIDDIFKYENEWCSKKYNDISIGKPIENFNSLFPHECLTNTDIECPTSCNYLKERNQLPTNIDNTKINCGTDEYKIKYLKYKTKYLKLKEFINEYNH